MLYQHYLIFGLSIVQATEIRVTIIGNENAKLLLYVNNMT